MTCSETDLVVRNGELGSDEGSPVCEGGSRYGVAIRRSQNEQRVLRGVSKGPGLSRPLVSRSSAPWAP